MALDTISLYNAFGKVKSIEQFGENAKPKPISQQDSGTKSFSEMLTEVVDSADNTKVKADEMIKNMMTGEKPVMVHDAMIALEKADIAFNLMNQVRRRIVRAYEEVMRSPI